MGEVGSAQMRAILVWTHVGLMMVAFGASPLGRLGLRYVLASVSGPHATQAIAKAFSGIFLAGGISVTAGVGIGLMLAWNTGLTQTWITASIALIAIAGLLGVLIEDRWLNRLNHAQGDAFSTILNEKVPFLVALASPVIWLVILWLMIEKPA